MVAILNKLTPQKFKTLVEQITVLDIDTPERLEGVIDRIFEKVWLFMGNSLALLSKVNNYNFGLFNTIARSLYNSYCRFLILI